MCVCALKQQSLIANNHFKFKVVEYIEMWFHYVYVLLNVWQCGNVNIHHIVSIHRHSLARWCKCVYVYVFSCLFMNIYRFYSIILQWIIKRELTLNCTDLLQLRNALIALSQYVLIKWCWNEFTALYIFWQNAKMHKTYKDGVSAFAVRETKSRKEKLEKRLNRVHICKIRLTVRSDMLSAKS